MVREAKRRVQVTGGSTHIISLPMEWVKKMGIERGDEIKLVFREDNTILIGEKGEKGISEAVMTPKPEETIEDIYRSLIAHYLVGYDVIKLVFSREIGKEDKKWMKDAVRKRLMGLEVVEESGMELVLRGFINYEDFPLNDAIKSTYDIIESMQEDVMTALRDGNTHLAEDVIQRDNEADRFYLLTVRQLKAAIEYPDIRKKIGITRPSDILGYRLIVKSMERIGDHAKKVAQNVIQIGHKMDVSQMFDMHKRIKAIFSSSLETLSDRSVEDANLMIGEGQKIVEAGAKVREDILAGELASIEKICLLSIVDSLVRIAEYIEDIAEICINMSVKRT